MIQKSKNIKIAKNRIDTVRREKLRFLNLSGLNLAEIPDDISDMTYLLDIDLSFNELRQFPQVLSKLDNLQYLDLSNNSLQDVCLEYGRYYSFIEINISNNLLNHIPNDLLFFEHEVKIIYNNNPFLNGLPPELEYNDELSYLNFYLDSLGKPDNKKRLFETKLLIVGKGEVGKTTLMKVLENPIYDVALKNESTTHGINIREQKRNVFFLAQKPYYNKHEDFENLYLKQVDYYFDENLEKEILEIEYLNLSQLLDGMGNEEIIELRVSDEPYNEYGNFYFSKEVKINTWDFGGQEILYSTHQFFLTQRSIYIFVWEPRSDNEVESFDYWLNIIQRLSNNSPVIIVMNKSDIRIKNIDEVGYKEKFKNIVGFYRISCLNKEGIHELGNQIDECIINLPHIGDLLPLSWDNIRLQLRAIKKDYISFQEFKDICGFKDDKEVNHLSGYLNDLGDIIHFKNDFRLNNLIIINPNWLTKAIYELIHSLEIQRNDGLFNADDLVKYLSLKKYPKDKYFEILLLMEKFEMCFKILGSNNFYIIPTLLQASPKESEIIKKFRTSESLKLQINYNFMPSGLIERLICRLNNYLEGKNFWKYGAVFNTEFSQALVISNRVSKTINLYVMGDVKANLYSIIFHQLNEIHKDLKLNSGDYSEMLACNCIQCLTNESPFMFKRKTLLKFLEKSRNEIDCQESTEKVVIQELLTGYRSNMIKNSLIRDFINAFSQLQTKHKTLKKLDEDERNAYLNELLKPHLKNYSYITHEQARRGRSESGKKQGELDIVIDNKEGVPISFFEGFNLNSVDKTIIDKHIIKTIDSYDSNGLKEKFIGVYCEAKKFSALCQKYLDYIKSIKISNIDILETKNISHIYVNASEMKVYKTIYERSQSRLTLYHILINLKL